MTVTARQGLITRVVGWLRAGYPEGIPGTDYPPLLALLSRRLTGEEVESIAADLASSAGGPADLSEDDIRRLIRERLWDGASAEDVARVSGRLAAAGWPLGTVEEAEQPQPATTVATSPGGLGRPLGKVVAWLREGYPLGVPEQDYVPLLALLRRQLTDDEVKAVAKTLRRAEVSPVGRTDIAVEITKVTNELPSDKDLERVRARLARKGWALDFPESAGR